MCNYPDFIASRWTRVFIDLHLKDANNTCYFQSEHDPTSIGDCDGDLVWGRVRETETEFDGFPVFIFSFQSATGCLVDYFF